MRFLLYRSFSRLIPNQTFYTDKNCQQALVYIHKYMLLNYDFLVLNYDPLVALVNTDKK